MRRTHGPHSFGERARVRRRVRRAGGAFLLLLFLVANPAYACPIDCLLNHHADRIEHADRAESPRSDTARLTGDMCHHGPQLAPQEAPAERALSPQEPAAVPAELPAADEHALGTVVVAAPRDPSPSAPPSPPPQA